MAAKECAAMVGGVPCGAHFAHPVHGRHHPSYHKFEDASKGGLKPVKDSRAAYQASETHRAAYAGVAGSVCVFEAAGAPTECRGPITPHHTFPVGRAGSRERAERVAPVVPACAFHNTFASQQGIEWSESHWVTVGGRDWPLLMSDPMARELEATGREFRPAEGR